MHLFGIATRNVLPELAEYRNIQWETFCVMRVFFVFLTYASSPTVSMSAISMIDSREIWLRKHVRERMSSSIGPGIAANRMICAHECAVMKTFVAQEESITRERYQSRNSDGDVEIGGYFDTVADDDGIHENEGHVMIEVD